MYAVIVSGGKQYRVTKGDTIYVEKLKPGRRQRGRFRRAAARIRRGCAGWRADRRGREGRGKIVGQVKGEKIIIYKYKSKKNYHRRAGHRQQYTKVEITAVG